jgi:hypothetical protein
VKGRKAIKEESSFSEEKEAKRLLPFWPGRKRGKVFWFFFSKKNYLLMIARIASSLA